jgi:outer membrane protein OmpA-like peptidoglycan-associated protein
VKPGDTAAIKVSADMTMFRLEIYSPAGERLASDKPNASEWTGSVIIPARQPDGPMRLTVKAWDGGTMPGTAEVIILVESPATQGKASAAPALRIHFATGSAEIDPVDYPILKQVAERLLADPALDALIVGHADNTGGEEFNQQLSLARSLSVKNYLSEQFGIEGARLHVLGMGESEPIADDSTAEGRAANRGVELIWIDLEQSL